MTDRELLQELTKIAGDLLTTEACKSEDIKPTKKNWNDAVNNLQEIVMKAESHLSSPPQGDEELDKYKEKAIAAISALADWAKPRITSVKLPSEKKPTALTHGQTYVNGWNACIEETKKLNNIK